MKGLARAGLARFGGGMTVAGGALVDKDANPIKARAEPWMTLERILSKGVLISKRDEIRPSRTNAFYETVVGSRIDDDGCEK